jgi:hypothetical protein
MIPPRVLGRLFGLQDLVTQRHPVAVPEGQALQAVPEVQQLRAIAVQLAGQLGRRDALGDPSHDQDQPARPSLGAMQGGLGEGVEDPLAMAAAALVEYRGAVATVDDHAALPVAARAAQPPGVQPLDELGVAGTLVHKLSDRQVHGRLLTGKTGWDTPEYDNRGTRL